MIEIASLPSRELPPNYTVVDVGIGSHPFYPASSVLEDPRGELNTAWSFTEGRSYTGVDHGLLDHERAGQQLQAHENRMKNHRPGENIRMLFADIADPNIDIPPGSVDELLLANVLSYFDDAIPDYINRRRQLLARAGQLLAADGLLVVRENFTPHLYHPSQLKAELGKLGFRQTTIVEATNPAFEDLTHYYGAMRYDLGMSIHANRTLNQRYFGFALAPESTPEAE